MTNSEQPLRVESKDGTALAVWTAGGGPPMLLIHGSFGDHTAWSVPLQVLRRRYTTYIMDRRGFGGSEDTAPYSIEREFEDVAATIDAVAGLEGEPVIVWGHSYGANCAMGGAGLSASVRALILYEPSLGLEYPPGAIDAAEALLEKGDREGAVETMLVEVLEMSPEEVQQLRASPRWPNLVANAHTGPRECRVEEGWVYEPGQFASIAARTVLLSGSESPDALHEATREAAAAIPGAVVEVMEGHGHFAHRTDPEMVVDIVNDFVEASQ